jgi:hypothetical protein
LASAGRVNKVRLRTKPCWLSDAVAKSPFALSNPAKPA